MKHVCQFLILVCLTALPAQLARAQNTEAQWWPELDTYVGLSQNTRLSVFAGRSTDGNTYNSAKIGPNLDIFLKPLRKKLRTNDATKHRYLSFRIGYRHYFNTTGPDENRAILEFTPRTPLPWLFLLSNRNRSELRWMGDGFSWRYRNRLTLERSFRIKSFSFSPYAEGEIYYDSRTGDWTKNSYAFGASIPLGHWVEVKPYFERDNQSRTSPQHVDAFALKCSLYF